MGKMKGHNRSADDIRAVCSELSALLERRKAVQEEINEFKKLRIKGDLGFKMSDFNVAFRLYQLEQEDRDECIDTIRGCFLALGIGAQLNLFDAFDQPGESEAEPAEEAAPAKAGEDELPAGKPADGAGEAGHVFAAGLEAGRGGAMALENPHPLGSIRAAAWERGRQRGARERANAAAG